MSWQDIPGWSSFLWAYDEMVDKAQDGDAIVEIGVAFGRSIAYLARKVIDSGKDIKIYAVDPWEPGWKVPNPGDKPGWGGEYEQKVIDCGGPFNAFLNMMTYYAPKELERINVLRCTSLGASYLISGMNVCGVMIDGSHDYENVKLDINTWIKKLKYPGIIAGDDYCEKEFPGVVKAVNEWFGDPGYGLEVRGTTWLKRTGT